MDNRIKVLLLVAEPWRSDDSGGNTLNNFVEGMDGVEFAQIYCDDRMPDNAICQKYYQIPEREVVRNFFSHNKVGHKLKEQYYNVNKNSNEDAIPSHYSKKSKFSIKYQILRLMRDMRPNIIFTIRKFIWLHSNWKTPELERFILEFDPDVIYAPCYADPFLLKLTRYVKLLTKCRVITWSADDCYSLRHFSLDPFFWFNRLWNRHCLRKTYSYFDEFYSISEEEAVELEPVVNSVRLGKLKESERKDYQPLKIGILRKGVVVPDTFTPREVHKPIKFIYAGGLYLNRHKSLIEIANTLRILNSKSDSNPNGEVKAELHLYTGSQLNDKASNLLNDGRSVFNHGLISPNELPKIYKDSDVAIHCESFDLKYRLMTRLSFSTKIIDCFQSGCAILAIAWKEHTGIKCLKREDAAICVTSKKDIKEAVTRIVENPKLIQEYSLKAYECEKRNHRIEDVQKKLYDAFVRCSK